MIQVISVLAHQFFTDVTAVIQVVSVDTEQNTAYIANVVTVIVNASICKANVTITPRITAIIAQVLVTNIAVMSRVASVLTFADPCAAFITFMISRTFVYAKALKAIVAETISVFVCTHIAIAFVAIMPVVAAVVAQASSAVIAAVIVVLRVIAASSNDHVAKIAYVVFILVNADADGGGAVIAEMIFVNVKAAVGHLDRAYIADVVFIVITAA